MLLRDRQQLDMSNIALDIINERSKQQSKHGMQEHHILGWKAIVDEEVGEFDKEVCDYYLGNDRLEFMIKELIQVITVYVNIYDMLLTEKDRIKTTKGII